LKPVEYFAFWFRHRIDLKDYLEKFHGLQFTPANQRYDCNNQPNISIPRTGEYENTWYDSNQKQGAKTQHGIKLNQGNIIDWECIKHNCPPVEAVPIVLKRNASLSAYKTSEYKRLERIFKLTATRYRLTLPTPVEKYLNDRGVDHISIKPVFNLGSPVPYQVLFNYLSTIGLTAHELTDVLTKLFINARPGNYREMPRDLSVVVPVYDRNDNYIGFHGRKINPGSKSKYFNTGYLKDFIGDVLFGEERPDIQTEIKAKKQVILTKGMFDFFHCYQDSHKQVLSTLNQGISARQFTRIIAQPVDSIVVGFSDPKARSGILGLMHISLKKAGLLIPNIQTDLDAEIQQTETSINTIIAQAKQNMAINKESIRIAKLKKKKEHEDTLIERGYTFLVEKSIVLEKVKEFKGSPKKLISFIQDQSRINKQTAKPPFIRIPQTRVNDTILGGFGSELRLLLFLEAKSNPGTRTISYTNEKLKSDLDISESTLLDHKNKLKTAGYLLDQKKIKQYRPTRRSKMKRQIHFVYYPSLIKFLTENPDES